MDIFIRSDLNPIIKTSDVKPSTKGLKVLGAFNPGAIKYNGEYILLLRVAEGCKPEKGHISLPFYEIKKGKKARVKIHRMQTNDINIRMQDKRGVQYDGQEYLSTISNIRIARSKDGVTFKVDDKPFIQPTLECEAYGVEDARVTKIDDMYYITYTGVSRDGYCTLCANTRDFKEVNKAGIIFPPMNKDVAIFPRQINGRYYALHRPANIGFGKPSIWLSSSPDLVNWGEHRCIMRPLNNKDESEKIGGGAAPIETKNGWLIIYHAKGDNERYTLNTALLDLEDPTKVLARGKSTVFKPVKEYETNGFFGQVVFTNGHIIDEETIYMYYGACDSSTCLATGKIDDLVWHSLK